MTWNNWSKWCLLVAGMNIGLAASGLWHVGFQPGHILNIAVAVLLVWTSFRQEEL